MLKSRWLSTFTVIGAILIVLGIIGLILGPKFIYDPGQPVTGKEAWCYLVIGILMVMNGVITPQAEEKTPPRKSGKTASAVTKPVSAVTKPTSTTQAASNGTGRPSDRDVPVSADKTE